MSLSTLVTPRLISGSVIQRIMVIRLAHGASPKTVTKQLEAPSNIPGFFKYERDISRDKRYSNPQKLGDTPMRFLLRRLGHAYELYPLFILTGAWFIVFCYACYISFEKIEVWIDRSQETAPWDWERVRNDYWKRSTLAFDVHNVSHKRLELMEKLQDEMVEAAKKRGTR